MENRPPVFLIIAALAAFFWWSQHSPVTPTPGTTAPNDPIQTLMEGKSAKAWTHNGCTILPLARYDITARVLHRQEYHFDPPAKISPLDLCLAWGPLSNPENYKQIHFSQDGRWYEYQYDNQLPNGLASKINHCVANNHTIPANEDIRKQLLSLRENQTIRLKGFLIEATFPDGVHWRSSLSRDDKNGGACEIIWVESVQVLP